MSQKLMRITFILLLTLFSSASASEIAIDRTNLLEATQQLISNDFDAIHGLSVEDGGAHTAAFTQIFGGTSGFDVTRYLEERIRYMGFDPHGEKGTYAANYSSSFLSYIYSRDVRHNKYPKPAKVVFENSPIEILSPRTGFIAVGSAYTDPDTTWIDRMDTLVHEARHSDCTEVPSDEDLTAFQKNHPLDVSFAGRTCTHIHMPCPAKHPLAGELACDGHDWGAYTVGYVFSKAMYHSCVGCTERQKQEALATATDDFSRLFKDVQKRWFNHLAGTPDMRSIP